MSDDVSIDDESSWSSSQSDNEHQLFPKSRFPGEDDINESKYNATSQQHEKSSMDRRGRTKDRTRIKRKGSSHSNGRASSIDFIRKVPVSPFRRDNKDQQHDTLERQRLNHTMRTRSKSSSHGIAAQALFANSSHTRSATTSSDKPVKSLQAKIKRNSSEPYIDTQIPANYVRNIARRFQGEDAVQGDENSNVILVSMTETGDVHVQPQNTAAAAAAVGYEADNQISYIEVCAEPPMSISSIDSDTTADLDSPEHKARRPEAAAAMVVDASDPEVDRRAGQGVNPLSGHHLNNNAAAGGGGAAAVAIDMCSAGSVAITHSHASGPLVRRTTVPGNNEDPMTGPNTVAKYHGGSEVQPPVQQPPPLAARNCYTGACNPGSTTSTTLKMSSSGGLTSDSSDSMDKSTSSSIRTGYVRGRHKSYLRDTMQFSFYTGEKSASSSAVGGQQLSSDDSVYIQNRDDMSPDCHHPASPIVSDISTSGCSSGSDNDPPRGRWSDGSSYACPSNGSSYACPSNLGSYSSQKGSCGSRGHVHTNGCYGQRQRSVSPSKSRQRSISPSYDRRRIGYAEPSVEPIRDDPTVQNLSQSLPSLAMMSPLMSDAESVISPQPVETNNIPPVVRGSTKDPKVILRAAHLSNELVRLSQLLEKLHPQELQHLLIQRLRQRDSKAIVALGIILPRTSFPSLDHVHCVRCHKNYDPRQPSACTLKHPSAYVIKTRQDNRGTCFYCKACDGKFTLQGLFSYDEKMNSYMAGFCFNGQHSTNPADVNFGGIVKTCEEQGCVECYV